MSEISIRPLEGHGEYLALETLQKTVWQFDDREIIPSNELITISRTGGCVIGAFEQDQTLVGFVFGFPALQEGKPYHSSRMVATLPTHRNKGLGRRLKMAQRDFALSQGLDRITWTFDPLRSGNAHFNVARLGVTCPSYVENLYGESTSVFNHGLETDRFVVEWSIASERVTRRLEGLESPPSVDEVLDSDRFRLVNEASLDGTRILRPRDPSLEGEQERLLVEIPHNFRTIKKLDLPLAREWRQTTRLIFQHYVKKGYFVDDFVYGERGERRACYYILTRTR